jgi:YD repeat-containing protein
VAQTNKITGAQVGSLVNYVIVSSYGYTYYLDGNQRTKTDHGGKTSTYVYDGLGRLKNEGEAVSGILARSYGYEYDKSGNRSRLTVTGEGARIVDYEYDANNRLLAERSNDGAAVRTTRYHYDPNGNQYGKTASAISSPQGEEQLALAAGLATLTKGQPSLRLSLRMRGNLLLLKI